MYLAVISITLVTDVLDLFLACLAPWSATFPPNAISVTTLPQVIPKMKNGESYLYGAFINGEICSMKVVRKYNFLRILMQKKKKKKKTHDKLNISNGFWYV